MKKKTITVLCCIALVLVLAGIVVGIVFSQPASIIAEYEKDRAKKIDLFKESMPGYIVEADNRAGGVQFTFLFHSYNNKTISKNFVKKYNLKLLFPKAEIKISDSGVVRLNFKKDDYTKAAHLILTKISESESKIYKGYHTVIADTSTIKYKPDISLHAEDPIKLEYTVNVAQNYGSSDMPTSNDSNITDVNRILTTKAEYDAYIDLFAAEYDFEGYPQHLQATKDKYNEEFFETNALLVTKEITRGDGGYGLTVDNVYLSDNKIYVVIRTSHSEGIAPQMLIRKTFYIAVSKDAIKGATELITLE